LTEKECVSSQIKQVSNLFPEFFQWSQSTINDKVSKVIVTVTDEVLNSSLKLTDPHNHVIDVNESSLGKDIIEGFEILPVTNESILNRENIIINQEKTFQAYSTCSDTDCKIFFEDLPLKQTYEIMGLPSTHRPFSDLSWLSNKILVFDKWSQPHYGIHYAVDVIERNILLASPFPDQFLEE